MKTLEPSIPKIASAKTGTKVETITLKHLAMALAESHGIPKLKVNAVFTGLVEQIAKHLKKGKRIRIATPAGAQASSPYGPEPGDWRDHQDQGQQEDRLPRGEGLERNRLGIATAVYEFSPLVSRRGRLRDRVNPQIASSLAFPRRSQLTSHLGRNRSRFSLAGPHRATALDVPRAAISVLLRTSLTFLFMGFNATITP